MIQTLGTTTNFVIQYNDTFAFAKQRAQKLQQDAEGDFALLRTWFQNTTGFGTTNRVTLLVDTKSLAWNNGYHTNGTGLVIMNHFNAQGADPLADDAVMALFVAEIIEVLMSARDVLTNKITWIENHSDGEGLSRMAAGMLHPQSYYNPTYLGGPYVNGWLQSASRPDWISGNEPSDGDGISFGCSLLFLYWLHSQLNFSMTDIVSKAGATLEATYHALTGNSGAYATFTQFLAPFFPLNETAALSTDDPFPLEAGAQRTVQLALTEVGDGGSTVASTGVAHVSPSVLCIAKDYHYTIFDTPSKIQCVATVSGFAQPVYQWTVNGVAASNGAIQPTATVYTDVPTNPNMQNSAVEQIKVNCTDVGNTSTWQAMSHELDITNLTSPGHEQLIVKVSVREQFASSDTVTAVGTILLDTQKLQYEAAYYADGAKCKQELAAIYARLQGEDAYNPIPIVLTLPDPPPELYNAAKIMQQMANEVAAVAVKDPTAANQVATELAGVLQVSPRLLGGTTATVARG